MASKQKQDTRPRFGFCWCLDNDPQTIREHTSLGDSILGRVNRVAVAVIPLPFMSSKQKAKIRAFAKTLWPTT